MATLAGASRTELGGGAPPQGEAAPAKPAATTNSFISAVEQLAGMLILAWQTAVATFTPPYSWRNDVIDEAWLIIRRCFVPVFLVTAAWAFGSPGLTGANIVNTFGTVDRMGALFVMVSVREGGPWLDGMVVAGVAGTAICADLGARKVREEIDALSVLGIDPVRSLVVPRVLALGAITALMNFVAIAAVVLGGWLAAVVVFGETTAGFVSTFSSNFALPDLIASVVKTSIFGFIIAIVCCYKGLNVKGGAEGVGRAVNQGVVSSFVGIWVFNSIFTFTLLAAVPELGNLH